MKKLIIGLTLLASMSSFANDCSVEAVDSTIVETYNAFTYDENRIEVGDRISNFDHVSPNFIPALEHYLGSNGCPQFDEEKREKKLRKLFSKKIKVNVVDETGFEFKAKRKRTTTEIAKVILSK
jgi:hypothetical protein